MSLTFLKRSLYIFWAVLCLNPIVFLFGQSIHPADGTHSVGENYPELVSPTSISITLPDISFDGLANLSAWELNNSVALRPQKGSPNTWNSRTFTYTPTDYEEGTDSITWKALRDDTISYETYKFNIEITGVNNPPVIQNTPLSFSFYENQNYVDTITVFDPDSLVKTLVMVSILQSQELIVAFLPAVAWALLPQIQRCMSLRFVMQPVPVLIMRLYNITTHLT